MIDIYIAMDTQIRGITYNTMAQRYIHNLAYPNDVPCWPDRLLLIYKKISLELAFICLQEQELATIDVCIEYFANHNYGYVSHAIINKGKKKRTNVIGNITFYRKDKLILLDSDVNSCGVFTTFIDVQTNNKFWLANIHLRGGLRSAERERETQLISCMKKKLDKTIPGCICGDFNDDLREPSTLLKCIFDKEKFVCHGMGQHTTCCVYNDKTLKHNFYQFDNVAGFNIQVEISKCPDPTIIPNESEPSDHLAVEFSINFI